MQKKFIRVEGGEAGDERRRQRVRLLETLRAICRRVERMQSPGLARRACRDVAEGLRQWIEQESARLARGGD